MPRQFGRYEVTGKIGGGGMGVVLRARDPKLGREVAVKVVPSHLRHEPTIEERFRREAMALARISHPAIVRVYDAGVEQEEFLYYVMELLPGVSLETRTCRADDPAPKLPQPFSRKEFFSIFTPMAEALSVIHDAGLIHRDVKPANIIAGIPERGAVLTDFGLAWMAGGAQLTQEGLIVGTGRYMAPEQIRGEPANAACDIYGLGATMWEYITCVVPFAELRGQGLLQGRLAATMPDVRTRVESVPASVAELVARSVALDPADRFPSARALHEALVSVAKPALTPRETPLGRRVSQSGAVAAPPAPWARARRGPLLTGAAVFLLAAAGLLTSRPTAPAPAAAGPGPAIAGAAQVTVGPRGSAPSGTGDTGSPAFVVLAPPGPLSGAAALAASGDCILALWVATKKQLVARLSIDGGQSWRAPGIDGLLPAELGPELALASLDERFYILFIALGGREPAALYCTSTDLECREWSSPVRVGEAENYATRPALSVGKATGATRLLALWKSPTSLTAAWSDPSGRWSEPASLGVTRKLRSYTSLVGNNEGLAVWQEEGEVRILSDVYFARSPGPAAGWSGRMPLELDQAGLDRGFFTSSVDPPHFHLQWTERPLMPGKPLFAVSSTDGGRTWTHPRAVSARGDEARANTLVARGKQLWSVWESAKQDCFLASSSANLGLTWSTPLPLTRRGNRQRLPGLLAREGEALVLLVAKDEAATVVRLRASRGALPASAR